MLIGLTMEQTFTSDLEIIFTIIIRLDVTQLHQDVYFFQKWSSNLGFIEILKVSKLVIMGTASLSKCIFMGIRGQ